MKAVSQQPERPLGEALPYRVGDRQPQIGCGGAEMRFEQMPDPRLVVDHGHDRCRLDRQRSGPQHPPQHAKAQTGDVRAQSEQMTHHRLSVPGMLDAVNRETVLGRPVEVFYRLEDLDQRFETHLVRGQLDDYPAQHMIDLNPFHPGQPVQRHLHRVAEPGGVWAGQASHLEMGAPIAQPHAAAGPARVDQTILEAAQDRHRPRAALGPCLASSGGHLSPATGGCPPEGAIRPRRQGLAPDRLEAHLAGRWDQVTNRRRHGRGQHLEHVGDPLFVPPAGACKTRA